MTSMIAVILPLFTHFITSSSSEALDLGFARLLSSYKSFNATRGTLKNFTSWSVFDV